ncbi:Protein tyrosine phosphatase type IVA 1 [Nowakowskiella sp. JEL0078]|nr:Protein tyrosine phosphatase type IVA 1 [Nowakowskiella sp. JEL0078]
MNPAVSHSDELQTHSRHMSQRLPNSPTLIEYRNLRFVVFDAPSERTLELYHTELLRHGVTDVVRVCEPTYDKVVMESRGIKVHDWPFPDGDPPPAHVVEAWLQLVNDRFQEGMSGAIGVHCVAGLGRAPVLVAMALIEAGMKPLDSVIYIRERRRGAINARQLTYIEHYHRKSKEKCVVC